MTTKNIDPAFIKIKPINELDEINTITSGWLLFDSGDGKLKKMSVDNFYQILNNFARPIAPSDAGPFTADRWYKPTTSSPDPGTNYPNAGSLKAINGYDTLFWYNGSTWTKTEVELTGVTAEEIFDADDNVNPSTMKATADRYDKSRNVLLSFLDEPLEQDTSMGFTDGYLSRQNTIPVTAAENKSKLNVDVTNFNKINFKGYPSVITAALESTYCCILGIKEDGTKVVVRESVIIPPTPPQPQTIINETFDISDYNFLSISIGNMGVSLNQIPEITLIDDSIGMYQPNAVKLYIDEEINNVKDEVNQLELSIPKSEDAKIDLNNITSFSTSNLTTFNNAAINSGILVITGTGSAVVKENTLNENSEISFIYKEITASNTMFGFNSLNTYGNAHHVYLRYNTSGTNNGKLEIVANKTLSYSQLSATTNTNYSIGDYLKLTIKRKGLTYYFAVYNLTKGWSLKMQQVVTPLATPFAGHNAASPAVVNTVGNVEVYAYKHIGFSSNIDYAINGDSITYGQSATIENNRWASQIKGNNIVMGGGADTTGLVLVRVSEIIKLNPKKVLLMIGGNDILYSLPSATWQQNLKDIRTALTTAGIEVIHLFPTPRAGASQLINFIQNEPLFRTDLKIDTNTLLMNGNSDTLAAVYDSGDHLHPNEAGHVKIVEIINSVL